MKTIKKLSGFKSSTLPILDKTVYINDGIGTVTNLEQTIRFITSVDNGFYNTQGVKMDFENEDFPILDARNPSDELVYSSSLSLFLKQYKHIVKFTANDELRPVVCAINFSSEQGVLIASDAHMLRTLANDNIKKSFLLPKININDFETLTKGNESIEIYQGERNLTLVSGSTELTIRNDLGKYPNWVGVIPQKTTKTLNIEATQQELNEVQKECKSIGALPLLYFNEKAYVSNVDFNYKSKEFNFEIKEKETVIDIKNLVLIMPGGGKDGLLLNLGFLTPFVDKEFYFTEFTRAFICYSELEDKPVKKASPNNKVQELEAEIKRLKAEIQELKKKQSEQGQPETPKPTSDKYKVIQYTDKAIVVVGDTREIKEDLKAIGGRFNRYLKCGAGWVFPKSKEYEVNTICR